MIEAHFTAEAVAARLVPIRGARNLRDLGGYPTRDGQRVRRGMVFRGGHPAGIAEEDLPSLAALKLRAIVDLRTTEERESHPYAERVRSGVEYWARTYSLSGGDFLRILRDPASRADLMRARMIDSYRTFTKEQKEGIAAVFRLLLDERVPLLFNCTAGKDRTGVVSAILLSALGVPEDIVRRDYALTEELHPPGAPLFEGAKDGPFAQLAEIDPGVWRAMMRSEPAYIDAMFEALHAEHGDVATYLSTEHGLDASDLAALRRTLLEQ